MNETSLPQQLKTLMARQGLHAAEVARRAGLSMASLSRLLAGKTAPTFETMTRLAAVLGVSVAEFAPHDAAPAPQPGSLLQAVYCLENTDHSPAAAAKLLAQTANGAWVRGAYDDLAQPGAPMASVLQAVQVGTRRVEITVGFPHQLVEAGSLVGALSVAGSALTGTGAKLLDVAIPATLLRTFPGPRLGVHGLRDMTNKHGRPLLIGTIRPMAGLSARQYGRAAFEALSGGADITADPTMLHGLAAPHWRERARFTAEAALAASRESNEFKAHLFNITAPTLAQMEERAMWARELDMTMVLVDAAAIGWAALQSLAAFCAKEDLALAAMGGRALFGDMLSEQLQAKLLRLCGADMVSTGSPLRGNVANRRYVQGVLAALRDDSLPAAPEGGQYLPQTFGGLAGAMPAVGGGHNPWHFARLLDAVGNHTAIQCGGSMFGHPQGVAAGATACRTALEALVQAKGEGLSLAVEGRNVLQKAAKFAPELRSALDHFQEGSFLFGLVQVGPGGPGQALHASVLPTTTNPSPAVAPSNVLTPFRRPEPPKPPTHDQPDQED
ncbi:MAG: helix-turn-helix domain-containing protein [Alphaproteobacteria bacterium]|nr:helix-turn-helix domain-containing protein [Alphaproteobacteria bacterium]